MSIQQLAAQGQVEPLDLAGGGRRGRGGEPVSDAILAADLVEQHLASLTETISKLLAIVSEDFLRNPVFDQGSSQSQAHRPAGGPLGDRGDHTKPGMVIN